MKTEKKLFYFSILLLLLFTASFRWPVKEAKLTSTFGESRWDHFHDGIDMVSTDPNIYPAEAGKLLFFWDKSLFPLENYPGGGNFRVLAHKNGLYSIYMHLEDGTAGDTLFTGDTSIGRIGSTGHSFARHLHFCIFNAKTRSSVNPLTLLPEIKDDHSPEVNKLFLRIHGKYVGIRDNSDIRLTHHYPLLISIRDSVSGSERIGIYKLTVECNGKRLLDVNFNKISSGAGGLLVDGMPYQSIFDRKGYYRVKDITYREGENRVRVTAADYAGNETEKVFTFTVKLDMDRQQ